MRSNIATNDAFVVELIDAGGNHNPDYDSIAQGIRVQEDPSHPEGAWGTASWFDKVSGVMRMCLIQKPPVRVEGQYRIQSVDGEELAFVLITKVVYDTIVRRMLPDAPEFTTDEQIQEYVRSLSTYE